MTFTFLVYVWRKPGLSPAQFKHYYETVHIPLVTSIVGDSWPLTHVRRYTALKEDSSGPSVMLGDPTSFDYDVLVEETFEDEGAFQRFYDVVRHPDHAKTIEEDEDRFLDRARMRVVVVGDIVSISPEQRAALIGKGSSGKV